MAAPDRLIPCLLGAALLTQVNGCVLQAYDYYRPEFAGGEVKASGKCNGPRDTVQFRYANVYVSARLQGLREFSIEFNVPERTTAQLKSDTANLYVDNNATPIAVKLLPVNDYVHSATDLMKGGTRTIKSVFGDREWHNWYPFKADREPLVDADAVVLVLPDLYVDGTLWPGPHIPFRKERSLVLDALNC